MSKTANIKDRGVFNFADLDKIVDSIQADFNKSKTDFSREINNQDIYVITKRTPSRVIYKTIKTSRPLNYRSQRALKNDEDLIRNVGYKPITSRPKKHKIQTYFPSDKVVSKNQFFSHTSPVSIQDQINQFKPFPKFNNFSPCVWKDQIQSNKINSNRNEVLADPSPIKELTQKVSKLIKIFSTGSKELKIRPMSSRPSLTSDLRHKLDIQQEMILEQQLKIDNLLRILSPSDNKRKGRDDTEILEQKDKGEYERDAKIRRQNEERVSKQYRDDKVNKYDRMNKDNRDYKVIRRYEKKDNQMNKQERDDRINKYAGNYKMNRQDKDDKGDEYDEEDRINKKDRYDKVDKYDKEDRISRINKNHRIDHLNKGKEETRYKEIEGDKLDWQEEQVVGNKAVGDNALEIADRGNRVNRDNKNKIEDDKFDWEIEEIVGNNAERVDKADTAKKVIWTSRDRKLDRSHRDNILDKKDGANREDKESKASKSDRSFTSAIANRVDRTDQAYRADKARKEENDNRKVNNNRNRDGKDNREANNKESRDNKRDREDKLNKLDEAIKTNAIKGIITAEESNEELIKDKTNVINKSQKDFRITSKTENKASMSYIERVKESKNKELEELNKLRQERERMEKEVQDKRKEIEKEKDKLEEERKRIQEEIRKEREIEIQKREERNKEIEIQQKIDIELQKQKNLELQKQIDLEQELQKEKETALKTKQESEKVKEKELELERHAEIMKTLGVNLQKLKENSPNILEEIIPFMNDKNYIHAALIVKNKLSNSKPEQSKVIDKETLDFALKVNKLIPDRLVKYLMLNKSDCKISQNEIEGKSQSEISDLIADKLLLQVDPLRIAMQTLKDCLQENPSIAQSLLRKDDCQEFINNLDEVLAQLEKDGIKSIKLSKINNVDLRDRLQEEHKNSIIPAK